MEREVAGTMVRWEPVLSLSKNSSEMVRSSVSVLMRKGKNLIVRSTRHRHEERMFAHEIIKPILSTAHYDDFRAFLDKAVGYRSTDARCSTDDERLWY